MVSIIIDSNILLRSYQLEDAQELFTAVHANRSHLQPWLDWVSSTTRVEHSLQFIQQSLHQIQSQEGLALGIFHTDRIIGGLGMHQWDHKVKKAQIGYWISKEHEGSGLLYQCLSRFIDFLFGKVGLNKIEIHFVPTNIRSAKLAERLGAKKEGILRESCTRNGQLEDIIAAGLLRKEWKRITAEK